MFQKHVLFLTILILCVYGTIALLGQRSIYVATDGNDRNNGAKSHPVRTIQRAVILAKPGTSIEILPGIYRETLTISQKKRIRLHGNTQNGQSVTLTGAEPSASFTWSLCSDTRCPRLQPDAIPHVYVVTLPWNAPPTILTERTADGQVHELTRARSPNIKTVTPDKFHEFWWQAEGPGQSVSTLVDSADLKNSADASGGRAFLIDGADRCGTYLYARSIKKHDRANGTLTMDAPIGALTYGNQENGVSQYTKYFIDNTIGLLDSPGEWYYDAALQQLYLWPLEEKNPQTLSIEIGKRDTGILLSGSTIAIDNMSITTINDHDYFTHPTGAIVMNTDSKIQNIRLTRLTVEFSGSGVYAQTVGNGHIQNIHMDSLKISGIAKSSVSFLGSPTSSASIDNVRMIRSDISTSGFPFNEPAISFTRVSRVNVAENTVRDVASYGIHVTGYEKSPTVLPGITITGNSVSHACQNASGCAAIKIFGGTFSQATISRNTVRDQLGWSYCKEAKENTPGYAIGIFVSNASGIRVTRNHARTNSGPAYLAFTRQIPAVDNSFEYNNAERNQSGIVLQGAQNDMDTDALANATRHDRTSITHNMLKGNQTGLILDPAHPDSVNVIGNIYTNNTVALESRGIIISTPSAIITTFPYWRQ